MGKISGIQFQAILEQLQLKNNIEQLKLVMKINVFLKCQELFRNRVFHVDKIRYSKPHCCK